VTVVYELRPSGQKRSAEVGENCRNWYRKMQRLFDVRCCRIGNEILQRDCFIRLNVRSRSAILESTDEEYKRTRSCTLRVVHLNAGINAWTRVRIGIPNQYPTDEWLVPAACSTRECANTQWASRKTKRGNNPGARLESLRWEVSVYIVAQGYV
jgi:hypothetical protein